jgi:hypothetical protein
MSNASNTLAPTLDSEVASLDTRITAFATRISAIEATLTVNQRSGFLREALEAASEMGSLAVILFLSRMFPDNATETAQRALVWLGLRIRRRQAQLRRAALLDFAAQCRNADQIHETLVVPVAATLQQLTDAVDVAATRYVASATDDELAVEFFGRKFSR